MHTLALTIINILTKCLESSLADSPIPETRRDLASAVPGI